MPKFMKRFLSPDIKRRLTEGLEDIRHGRLHGPLQTARALVRSLHQTKKTKSS
jgi:hypothetical protein